jgi:hypothetical protein
VTAPARLRFAGATIKRCVARPVEEIEMADVGDRIAVTSKGEPRSGVVTAVSGAMITVRWDTGGETSLTPGPGVLSVVTSRRRTPSARTHPTTSGATAAARKTSAAGSRNGVAKKAAPGKKAAAGRTPVAKKPTAKKPVAKKAAPGKKPVAKATSSSRTSSKKTR